MGRPDFCDEAEIDEYIKYLDNLQKSGDVNMFGARPYLVANFPELTRDESLKVMKYYFTGDWVKGESDANRN